MPPARRAFEDAEGWRYEDTPALRLRPGDVIEVRANEVVPADARLIAATDVEVDEAALTGESLPVAKQIAPTPGAGVADRACMLFAQTTVVTGTAVLAVQTGAMEFAWLAVGIFAFLLVAWAVAFANTLRTAWTGAAFLPAPVPSWPRST